MRRGPRSGSPASLLVGSVPGARAERWTCTGAGTRSGTRCFRLTVVMRASFFYGQRFYSIYPGSRYTIFRGFLSWFCFGYRIRSAQGRPAEGCASDAGVRTLPCHPVVLSSRRPVVPSSRRPVVPSSRRRLRIFFLFPPLALLVRGGSSAVRQGGCKKKRENWRYIGKLITLRPGPGK